MQQSPVVYSNDFYELSRTSSKDSFPSPKVAEVAFNSSSSSSVTIRAESEGEDWFAELNSLNQLDPLQQLDRSSDCSWGGWSSAGGYDDFDRKANEVVNSCLSSVDKLLYEGVLDGNANSEITEECKLWLKNSNYLRLNGKRMGHGGNWEGFDYYSPPTTSRLTTASSEYSSKEPLVLTGKKILPKVGSVAIPAVDRIIECDGVVEELIARDEGTGVKFDQNVAKDPSSNVVEAVINKLFEMEWQEVSEKMSPLFSAYQSSSSQWRSSHSSDMFSSDISSDVTPIPSMHHRSERRDSLSRIPPCPPPRVNSSLEFSKFTRESSRFRDLEPERRMIRNNWENRTFSRGSQEFKYHNEQVIADLTQMVNKSISVKPIESRTMEGRTYTTFGSESFDPYNLRPISMSTSRLYHGSRPATTQNPDSRRSELRRGKIKRGKLEPLDNRSRTPAISTALVNEGLVGTAYSSRFKDITKSSHSLLDRMSPLGTFSTHRLPPIPLDDIREEKGLPTRATPAPPTHRRPTTAEALSGGNSAHGARRPLSNIVSQIGSLRHSKNVLKGITGQAPPTYRKNYI